MAEGPEKYSQFDLVRLLTTKNVKYLSAPSGCNVSPKGVWQVSAAIGTDLLLVKDNAIIRIPVGDVLKVCNYDLGKITANLGRLSEHVERERKEND